MSPKDLRTDIFVLIARLTDTSLASIIFLAFSREAGHMHTVRVCFCIQPHNLVLICGRISSQRENTTSHFAYLVLMSTKSNFLVNRKSF